MKKLIFLIALLFSFTVHSQCVIDGTAVTGPIKGKIVKACDAVIQSLTDGMVSSRGDSLKTAVNGVDYIKPGTGYAFTAWSSSIAYVTGNVAYSAGHIWAATGSSTNELPGSGSNWTLLTTNTSAYGVGWNGSVMSPTQDAVYDMEALDFRKDGSRSMTGNIDCGGNDVINAGVIDAGTGFNIDATPFARFSLMNGSISIGASTGSVSAGNYNFAFGYGSLGANVSGSGNAGLGALTLKDLTTGQNNVGAGQQAGQNVTSGSGGVYMGVETGVPSGSGTISNVIVAGYAAAARANGQAVFGGTYCPITEVYFGNGQGWVGAKPLAGNPVYIHANGDVTNSTDNDNNTSPLVIRGARGVGNGGASGVKFQYSPLAGSGTTYQTWTDGLVMNGNTGDVAITNNISANNLSGTNTGDLPSGSFSGVGTATTTFTVTIGSTQANTTYKVVASPSNVLSAAVFYINNKTTTTFDVVYIAGLTGTVAFDWILAR